MKKNKFSFLFVGDFNLAVLSFKIANDRNYSVYENLNYLRSQIRENHHAYSIHSTHSYFTCNR